MQTKQELGEAPKKCLLLWLKQLCLAILLLFNLDQTCHFDFGSFGEGMGSS